MATLNQTITDEYALYHGDSGEVLPTLPDDSVHLSIYSPPFATENAGCLYHYSSSPRDVSNSRNREEFFEHYGFFVEQIHRATMPGRSSLVHCIDVPTDGANFGGLLDFPGDIIRLHQRIGFDYCGRYHVWKEPLGVRNRTMSKGLAHQTVVEDATWCSVASADYLLRFRKRGDNPVPIEHREGLLNYAGERAMPADLLQYRGHKGKQTENRFSHWIWRRYADAFWDDIRIDRVLPFKESRDEQDERHVHPLQLDVIERAVVLWSNPGEVVLTPFMGVGSEVYGAVLNGRKGIGIELKATYYRQAVKNCAAAVTARREEQEPLFAFGES